VTLFEAILYGTYFWKQQKAESAELKA